MVTTFDHLDATYKYIEKWIYKRDQPDTNNNDDMKFKGCNSFDDDGENGIDNCAEDDFPPEIDTSLFLASCGSDRFLFNTIEHGKACIEDHVIVSDDCSTKISVQVSGVTDPASSLPAVDVDACSTRRFFEITATENRCQDQSKKQVSIIYDSHNVMTSTVCNLSNHLGKAPELDISRAIELCTKTFFKDTNVAERCVKDHVRGSSECRKVSVDVTSKASADSFFSGTSMCTETRNVTVSQVLTSSYVGLGALVFIALVLFKIYLSCSHLFVSFPSS